MPIHPFNLSDLPTLRTIFTLCIVLLAALGISAAHAAASDTTQKLMVKPGDLIVKQEKNAWSAIKILSIDSWPDGTSSAHCLLYKSLPGKPTLESLKRAEVLIFHAPIAAGSLNEGWERIGNQAVTKDDLVGFVEYLRLTDFLRYLKFTGQDAKKIIDQANDHYTRAKKSQWKFNGSSIRRAFLTYERC